MNKSKKIWIISLIIGIFVFIGFFREIINFIVDYQWFSQLGYREVFLTKLKTQLQIGIPIFIVASLFYYIYLRILKRDYYKKTQAYEVNISEKRIHQIMMLPSIILGFMTSTLVAGNMWFSILTFINAENFHITDPIFNKDVAFYMLQLPVIEELLSVIVGLLVALLVVTFLFYAVMFILRQPTYYEAADQETKLNKDTLKGFTKLGRKQLTIIGVAFFIVMAANFYLAAYGLLHSSRGVVYGAGYTDIHVNLWVYRIQMFISILSAIALIIAYKKDSFKKAMFVPVTLIIVSVLGNFTAIAIEKFVVDPNVIAKELPYIEHNIQYTNKAYGLDEITVKDFNVKNNLTLEDLENNEETIKNIRLNDYRPTVEAYNQLQAIRSYYRFLDVDIDRYMIDGEYTQVFLAPRELDHSRLSENAQTWINRHLKYTHGYGVVLSPVNAITSEGQPQLAIRNIPPVSTIDIEVTRPEIYFGELTNDYIIVNTKEKEFDYPMGGNNAETLYEGDAGIPLGGLNRLLYAIYQRDFRILISNSITAESRIVLHRNVLDRVNKLAPFIYYDEDPYIVIDDGRLYWVIDGYTVAGNYPYATPYISGNNNYIRNAVKVVIDVYHGDVDYYIADEDPIVQTYSNIFPSLFKDLEEMPEGLKNHIRYPQDLFDIQAKVYELYHMTNPSVFHTKEDIWNIAQEKYAGAQQDAESQYMIMKLPGEQEEEFVLSIPYTPNLRNNMIALLMARNDGEHYGELIAYNLPKDENIYGPMQIENRIDGDSQISQSLTLWGDGGSSVIRGNLLVIPIEEALLYVEPLYIQAANPNSLPEVKQVIVAYRDQIVMKETLDEALAVIFGERKPTVETEDETTEDISEGIIDEGLIEELQSLEELIQEANEAFENANRASKSGDWAGYGKHIQELEDALRKLERETN